MSYALRNTLILLFVLLLFAGGGWFYLSYFQESRIETLQTELTAKQRELANKQQIANQYESLLEQYENARYYINNYPKALYRNSNEDKVFDFLNNLNTGSSTTDFTFTFSDSTTQNEFGILTMDITGEGYYRYFNNFLRKIELSRPINRISELNIDPINNLEDYGRVNFSFRLRSFYDRVQLVADQELSISQEVVLRSLNNPFYPLIREIEPNENNLINVEESDLLALSTRKAFVLDQTGVMQRLFIGDRVYLGELESINLQERAATFVLNKGGLIERVTLEVQDNDES